MKGESLPDLFDCGSQYHEQLSLQTNVQCSTDSAVWMPWETFHKHLLHQALPAFKGTNQ